MGKVATSMRSRRGETQGGGSRRRVVYARVLQQVVAEREKISRVLHDTCESLVPTTAAARDGVAYARHAAARQSGRIPGAKG